MVNSRIHVRNIQSLQHIGRSPGRVLQNISVSLHTTKQSWKYDEIDRREAVSLTHNEFESAVMKDEIQVIDVRTAEEVEGGHVPAKRYINIPVQELEQSLKMSESEFKERYGVTKPSKNANDVVFHCLRGGRSTFALRLAESAGYNNVKHYPGGWEEWVTKMQ